MTVKFDKKRFEEIYEKVLKFNEERGWDPKAEDLAKSVAIEAAELLELWQWEASYPKFDINDPKQKEKVMHEVADVMIYIMDLIDKLGLDMTECLEKKYEHNCQKYPAENFVDKLSADLYYQRKQEYRDKRK